MFLLLLIKSFVFYSQDLPVKFEKNKADFGDVKAGNLAMTTFSFENISTSDIQVLEVLPQCGCTSVDFSKNVISPGKKGEITLELDTEGKYGLERKTVTVIFSDKSQTVLVLKVNVI